MENYEKKYKSALEWIRSIYPTMQGAEKEDAEHYFPELRESEDEIFKEVLHNLIVSNDHTSSSKEIFSIYGKTKADCLAWLEKQGEQKPTWSEEDEKMFNKIIDELTPYGECPDYPSPEEQEYYYTRQEMVDWLQSLKPNHWKPSEEQMSMLLAVLNDPNNITSESVYIALKSLYNDIKKL